MQLRGYPARQHFEYRVGVFSGFRGVRATNALRLVARVAWCPWAAETGYFYVGTFQGSKRLMAIGASADTQKDYRSYGADVFFEQPFNQGRQGLTVQFDWVRFDGGTFLTSLPRQDTYLFEAGVHRAKGRLTPFVQYASRDFAGASPDEDSLQAGFAWWWKGHSRNLKASVGRLHTEGQPDRVQAVVQLQIYYY